MIIFVVLVLACIIIYKVLDYFIKSCNDSEFNSMSEPACYDLDSKTLNAKAFNLRTIQGDT